MYRRYVKVPIVNDGLRLDTVIQTLNGDFIYRYVQPIKTRPKLRKVDVVLTGDIYESDTKIYDIPMSDPLTFYISSLSAFVDNREKYLTKVIERRVEENTACYIEFASGSFKVDENMGHNPEEIGRIKDNLISLMQNEKFDLDSIVVTSSASPEGTVRFNERLSQKRSEGISDYLSKWMNHYQDSLERERGFAVDEEGNIIIEKRMQIPMIGRSSGENWQMLDHLVERDTVMTEDEKKSYISSAEIKDIDQRERSLQSLGCYRHMREKLYPHLRTVRFDFHLHRKGMVKDTVHTTVLDSTYMNGVQAIRDRDYETALTLLRPYNDYNTAIAYLCMDYNASAMQILESLDRTAQVNYMLAVLYSRRGDEQKAVECYVRSCKQNPSYVYRGNLDPEISVLIKMYGLNQEEEYIDEY
jgi:tetratricopeptide (TPR) repeat protein